MCVFFFFDIRGWGWGCLGSNPSSCLTSSLLRECCWPLDQILVGKAQAMFVYGKLAFLVWQRIQLVLVLLWEIQKKRWSMFEGKGWTGSYYGTFSCKGGCTVVKEKYKFWCTDTVERILEVHKLLKVGIELVSWFLQWKGPPGVVHQIFSDY